MCLGSSGERRDSPEKGQVLPSFKKRWEGALSAGIVSFLVLCSNFRRKIAVVLHSYATLNTDL